MIAAAIACLPFLAADHVLNRWEGLVFLGYYGAYVTFLSLDATGHDASDDFALFFGAIVVPLTVITVVTILIRQLRSPRAAETDRRWRRQPPRRAAESITCGAGDSPSFASGETSPARRGCAGDQFGRHVSSARGPPHQLDGCRSNGRVRQPAGGLSGD